MGFEPITSAIPVQCSTNTQLPCYLSSVHYCEDRFHIHRKPEQKRIDIQVI